MLPPQAHDPGNQPAEDTTGTAPTTTAAGGTTPPASGTGPPLVEGQALGSRYRILSLLGRGGMGAVYKAWDDQLGVVVALKTIVLAPGADPDTSRLLEQRFKREAVLARQITHPNVVRVHDLIDIDGALYLTMAFVEGETLADRMRRQGPMPPRDVLPLIRQIAEGLAAAHKAGIVHRDLKPANIMVTPSGEACIMDFGIARAANTTVTQSGIVVGTLEYMAPEQLQGESADARTDIYALGLIAYDMLAGRDRLHGVVQPMYEAMNRAERALPTLASKRPDVPAALGDLVDRAVRRRPDDRFASADDVLARLSELAADGHPKRDVFVGPEPWPAPAPGPRLRRALLVSGLLIAMVATIAVGAWRWPARTGQPPAAVIAPVSVVVAEFANTTGEAVFDGLLDQAMAIGLEGASFINVYPRRDALRVATQLKALGLDLTSSRLIGLREGIPLVVSGGIDRDGGGYRLRVEVHQTAPDGARVFAWDTAAADREHVLEEAGRMAAQVRRALGDGSVDVSGQHAPDTFTAASLDAAAAYVTGQELLAAGNRQGASEAYQRAVTLDPGLGRAWAGLGTVAYNQRRLEDAEKYLREALAHTDKMTERETLRTRGTYFDVVGNAEQARDVLEDLVARFPSDAAGLANLALAHFKAWHLPRALDLGRRAAALYPKNVLRQSNVALYALYASDFDGASRQVELVRSLNPDYPYAQLASSMIDLAHGRWEEAAAAGYARLGTLPAPGPVLAAHGRADLARHRGRLEEAERDLTQALAAADDATSDRLVTALAAVRAARGDRSGALAALRRLPGDASDSGALVEAAETYLDLGARTEAVRMVDRVERRLGIQGDTFAAVLRARIALADGRAREAQSVLLDARRSADAWLIRYWLGRSYLALGAFAEADSEFDTCLRRRGEVLAVFLDDYPTYHRLADVHYYQGLARAGLGSPDAAAEAFRAFLALKDGGDETGGLVADAKARLAAH